MWSAYLAIVVGSLVLLGWALDLPVLENPFPHQAPVAVTTAIVFVCSGLSILFYLRKRYSLARALGLICSSIGLIVLCRYCFPSFTLDIDQLLIHRHLAAPSEFAPGRMAPNTAFVFLVLGSVLALQEDRFYKLFDTGLLLVLMLSVTAVTAHMYGVQQIFFTPLSTQMATVTALIAIILTVATALLHPQRGFISEITTDRIGGAAARRLLPFAILVPLLAGLLRLLGQKAGLYDTNVGTTLLVALMILLLSNVIWWTASWLNKSDRSRQQAERELRDYSESTRLIVDSANDAFVQIDSDGKITDWNPSATKMFGWTKTEILGSLLHKKVVPEQISEDHHNGLSSYFSSNLANILNKRVEMTAVRKNGEQFPIELSIFPIQFHGTETFCAFINDISLRKEADRRISEFVSTVSHELRTPLTSIRGALRLLQGGRAGALTERADMLIGVANSEADRLIRLVNDMLDLQKIESGKLELKRSEVDLCELTQKALAAIQFYTVERGITVESEVLMEGRISCDEDRIIQVIVNLLSNAIKFSPEGGVVMLRIVKWPVQSVRFSITDSGPGISEDQKHKLFERFQQLDSSDARPTGGTGLGLAISKAIVEQHGGKIGLDSTVGSFCQKLCFD